MDLYSGEVELMICKVWELRSFDIIELISRR